MTIRFVSPYLSGMIVSLLNESDIEIRMITKQKLLVPFTINSKDVDNGLLALGILFEDPSKISSSKVKIITNYKLCLQILDVIEIKILNEISVQGFDFGVKLKVGTSFQVSLPNQLSQCNNYSNYSFSKCTDSSKYAVCRKYCLRCISTFHSSDKHILVRV